MNESDYNQLKEKSWRDKLTASEETALRAWLAEHPEARIDWELDQQLSEAIKLLADAPVPSNFTARVLLAAQSETTPARRPRVSWRDAFSHSWLPRAAVVALVILLSGVAVVRQRHVITTRRALVAEGIKTVTANPKLTPQVLQDFDTIRQIGTTPGPDLEVIALMK